MATLFGEHNNLTQDDIKEVAMRAKFAASDCADTLENIIEHLEDAFDNYVGGKCKQADKARAFLIDLGMCLDELRNA